MKQILRYSNPLMALCGFMLIAGCQEITAQIWIHGLPLDDVFVEVENLGHLSPTELENAGRRASVDRLISLPKNACGAEHCKAILVTTFIENKTSDPLPPPVIRLESPPGKPKRQALTSNFGEIEPGRTGRIRFITSMWPGEKELRIHLSGSVRLGINESGPPRPLSDSKDANMKARGGPAVLPP